MNQQKNFLKKCSPIEKSSDQFKVIQFKLQLSVGTTSLAINRIYNISNTHVSASFSSYAKGSIVLESFIETDKLIDQNRLQKVVQKGFDISNEGMVFNVGYNKHIDVRAQKQFSFVMCKIAVGKSYCYSERKYRDKPIQLPEGFDSIYLYNQEETPQVFLHKYAIFKNYQVYPSYLIDFSIDSYKQQQSKHPLCDNCSKVPPNQAKFYCVTQEAHFCTDCQLQYHNSKLGLKHQRVQLTDKPKKFGQCQKHNSQKLQLYCNVCYEALCVACKINGDHVSGQMGQHQLLKLKDAYSQISSKVKQNDPNIQRRKNQLTQDLSKIDLKIKQVNAKATHVEQQIYAHFQKALKQLHSQTQKKLSFLIGDQLQLKRQYDHIQWMESFLKYSLQVQQPHQFLHSWYKYSKYKKQVLSLANLSINTEVKADMKLEGSIHVVVQSRKKKGNQGNMPMGMTSNQSIKEPIQNLQITPTKAGQKTSLQKDIGSTQLRKTVFKKHYSDKSRFGQLDNKQRQPGTMKGSYDNRNPFTSDQK